MQVVKVEGIGKVYRLGEVGTGTLSHDLNRWWARVRGKEDPFAKIAQVNDRTVGSRKNEYVWALRDVNFSVEKGQVVGIIGKNGAGKSTLLKIISRITTPTKGEIRIKGRVASLLEVGTGFHPEMTGRENIFMNGTLMGMTRGEIQRKFDDIVDFAGVAKYVDTPVKRYSSGMTVRLGFAVAAFLEPEILIVDEVLAVGDAEFQKRAIGKMSDISKEGRRTVLFVSHNMASVSALCSKGILLRNGSITFAGATSEAISYYQNSLVSELRFSNVWQESNAPGNDFIRILGIAIKPLKGDIVNIDSGIRIEYRIKNSKENINLGTTLELVTKEEVVVFHKGVLISQNKDSKIGTYNVTVDVPPFLLNANIYKVKLIFGENQRYLLFQQDEIISFEVENTNTGMGSNMSRVPGIIRPELNWKVEFTD